MAAGEEHSIMLKQDGSVWSKGSNKYGQIGDGSNAVLRRRFVQVISSDVRAVAAGFRHSLVVKQDDSVWATGSNIFGELGDGSTEPRRTFVNVVSSC